MHQPQGIPAVPFSAKLALFTLAALCFLATDLPAAEKAPKKTERPVFWRGTLSGEFIGDTSGAKAARVFVPSIRIRFTVRIHGRVRPSGSFEGSYDARFEPAIKTFDFSKAEEVKSWEVVHDAVVEGRGRVTGSGPYTLDEDQKAFIRNLLEALEKALERWKNKPLVKPGRGRLTGPNGTLTPGALSGTVSADVIKEVLAEVAGEAYGENQAVYDAAAEALAEEVNACIDGYQGTLPYPAAGAFNAPQMPPTANQPVPLSTLASTNPLTAEGLVDALERRGVTGEAAENCEALAEVVETAWTVFEASNQILNVMGSGPVPSFAPPHNPVGPVVGGSLSGGSLAGGGITKGNMEGLLNRSATTLKLRFHAMPRTILVKLKAASLPPGAKKLLKAKAKQAMGNGYFYPKSLMYRRTFEGPVARRGGRPTCDARFDDEKTKPSPLKDGTLKEIARTRLTMKVVNPGADLPAAVREELGLGDDGAPPRREDGKFRSPSGGGYNHYALVSNLSLAGGDGSHDADGGVEARAAGGDGGNGHVALYYNSRRTSVRDTGLYLLVDAPAAAALRVTAGGGPAFTGLSKDGTVVLGLPRTFGLVRAGRQKFFLTTASGYTVTVKPGAEAPDLRLVVPSSPWTRRTYRVRLPAGEAPVAIAVERGGRVVLPRGVSAACTEDCDGRYRGRAVSLAPRAEAKPKTAPKKPAPKANPGFPAELAWPPGVDGTSMASIETTETVNGVKRLVRRTYSLMKSGAFDKDAILGHYKAIFAKHGWDGLFHDTPRAANGVFVKGKNTLTLLVARVGPKRLLFRFALEVNLRDGNAPPPKKKPGDAPAPKKPAPAEPKPRPEPEKPKPAAKVLPPDRFCEMMGKLILTLEPLVLEMKKAMKGKNGEGRMMVAMEYGPKIKAASKEVYDSYGVTEKWANEASRLPKYEKAFKAYLETHPDVKAALDRLKGS